MAEAVAGETGKPYVFVDPGAFIQMFMGVGILKVKSLFRKLRKLALRYGGVIVFFDEADSLGNRGLTTQGGPGGGGPGRAAPAPFANAGCHGFSYLSTDTQWRLTRDAMESEITDEPGTRRNKQIMGGMMGGGGGGMGTLQALLTELSGLREAARPGQPLRAADLRDAAEAAAQVPDPGHDGDQHALGAGRGAAASGAHRPHLQGRLPVEGGPDPHLRGVLRQGPARAHRREHGQAGHDHALRHGRHDQGPG